MPGRKGFEIELFEPPAVADGGHLGRVHGQAPGGRGGKLLFEFLHALGDMALHHIGIGAILAAKLGKLDIIGIKNLLKRVLIQFVLGLLHGFHMQVIGAIVAGDVKAAGLQAAEKGILFKKSEIIVIIARIGDFCGLLQIFNAAVIGKDMVLGGILGKIIVHDNFINMLDAAPRQMVDGGKDNLMEALREIIGGQGVALIGDKGWVFHEGRNDIDDSQLIFNQRLHPLTETKYHSHRNGSGIPAYGFGR